MRFILALTLALAVNLQASHIHSTGGQCIGGLIHPPTTTGSGYVPPPVPSPAPTVTSVSPTAGALAGGTSLSITGTGFLAGATSAVGGTACTSPNVLSSTSLSCMLPSKSAGTYAVTVTNTDAQTGTLSNAYTYQAAPTVSSVSPTSGSTAGGDALTITGTGFITGATVTVGGVTCTSPNVASSTSITCTSGAHAAGAVDIIVTNSDSQTGTGTGVYTYVAVFSPSDVSGLTLWLDASDSAKLYTDTGCTTPASSDGNAVKCWKDKSSNAYNMTEGTNPPLVKNSIQNSKNVVRFDGTNDRLDGPSAITNVVSAASFSAWYVFQAKSFGSNNADGFSNDPIFTEKTGGNMSLYLKSTPLVGLENYGGGQKVTKTIAANTWYIAHVRHDSGSIYISINDGAETSLASGNFAGFPAALRIGCNYDATQCAEIDIGEALMYNTAVGSTDRSSIQTYLNGRWATH